MEQIKERKDAKGNIISKNSKDYHVSFKENFSEIIEVESYKEYNILNEDDYTSIDDDSEDKFDINRYDPLKIEKIANHDPHGFSKGKCLIL